MGVGLIVALGLVAATAVETPHRLRERRFWSALQDRSTVPCPLDDAAWGATGVFVVGANVGGLFAPDSAWVGELPRGDDLMCVAFLQQPGERRE